MPNIYDRPMRQDHDGGFNFVKKFFSLARKKPKQELKNRVNNRIVIVENEIGFDQVARYYFQMLLSDTKRTRLAVMSSFLSACCLVITTWLTINALGLYDRAVYYRTSPDFMNMAPFCVLVAAIAGLISIAYFFNGVYCFMSTSSIFRKHHHRFMAVSQLTITVGILCDIFIVLVSLLYRLRATVLVQGGLETTMRKYAHYYEIKVLIDLVQTNLECCGSDTYKDWWKIQWWPDNIIDTADPEMVMKLKNGSFTVEDEPSSCCNVHSGYPCIGEFMLNEPALYKPHQHTVYQTGCASVIRQSYMNGVTYLAKAALLNFAVACLHAVVFRYLDTSLSVAISAGHHDAIATGYLWSRKYGGSDDSDTLIAIVPVQNTTFITPIQALLKEADNEANYRKRRSLVKPAEAVYDG